MRGGVGAAPLRAGSPATVKPFGWVALLVVALHVPLALVMGRAPIVSTAHALLTFAVGLWLALSPKRAALLV